MKILLACEHFYPEKGGVAKYMQELGFGLKSLGYEIEVVTTYSEKRLISNWEGILIHSFKISGNLVKGLNGEIRTYQDFLIKCDADILIVMAAQQSTFDALFEIIDQIKFKIINIPCGYSYLGTPEYAQYYDNMKLILPRFCAHVYHSYIYKDIEFGKSLNLKNMYVIPMGVNLKEIDQVTRVSMREKFVINSQDFIILNIGAPAINKGQLELIKAFRKIQSSKKITLILNSNYNNFKNISNFKSYLLMHLKELVKLLFNRSIYNIYLEKLLCQLQGKKVILCDLDRTELLNLYRDSNLFVFPSHVEYSPNVLFEAMAMSLPFVTNPVGNAEEIIEWTHGGLLISKVVNKGEFKIAQVDELFLQLEDLIAHSLSLIELGNNGRSAVVEKYNWENIISEFNNIIKAL